MRSPTVTTAPAGAPAAPALTGPWPFVGREAELRHLAATVTGRRAGSVVIAGPAGVGKTRLARELVRRAERSGLGTLWVQATPSTSRSPFGVFASLFDSVSRAGAGLDRDGTFDDLLQRFSGALLDRAADGRLLLVVDDAHVLDDASAGLVHQLVATDAVRVVATVRTGEAVPAPVTALWRAELAVRLDLEEIAEETVGEMLSTVLGGQVDRATVAELARHCRGNALFLRELTLGAVADGSLVRDVDVWRLTRSLRPSERIVELVEARLAGLDADARRLLELVAYAEPLDGAALAALADEGVAAGLERDGLLVGGVDAGRLRVQLSHPVYGDVVRSRTGAVRIAAMGRALAAHAEGAGGALTEDPLRIGIWRLDGGGGDPALLLAAGREARWRYDFRLAERLARAAAETGAGFRAELLAAQAIAFQGRPEAAVEELGRLAGRATNDADRARLGCVHVDCLWFHLGRMEEARLVGRRAEASIAAGPLRDEVSGRLVGVALGLEGPSGVIRMAEPLLERAEGRSLGWLGVVSSYAYGRLGRLDDAHRAADRGYAAAVGSDEPDDFYPCFNLYARCEALVRGGRFAEAEALAREQYRRGLEEGNSEARAWFLWHLCQSVRERGNVAAAVRDAREALSLFVALGRGAFQDSLRCAVAQALAVGGDHAGATDVLAELRVGDQQAQWSAVDVLGARAWTAVAGGRLATGRGLLVRAADLGERIGDRTGAAAALHDVARLGAPRQALGRLTVVSRALEGDLAPARVAHVEALCAGDPDALEGSAATFEELGAELLAAEAAADAALVRRRTSRGARSDAAMHRAASLAARCPDARTPALAPIEAREQLTPAERETALLAAAGRTNGEIAAELQLSVRTVGNRLYRLYRKLGVTRRDELDRLLR